GLIPAIACPFTPNYDIDEAALRKLASWLGEQPGVVAVMTNGHTGEVFSLTVRERAEVTRIVADELRGKLPVISSIVCEGVRDADPSKVILTCHDEYLLASMVQGVDGALVGFATFIPGLINDLLQAVKVGDLKRAMKIQDVITPLKDAVYGAGEPTGEAHARMKMGMYLA